MDFGDRRIGETDIFIFNYSFNSAKIFAALSFTIDEHIQAILPLPVRYGR